MEFDQLGGIGLIQHVLRTPQAAVGKKIAEVTDVPAFIRACLGHDSHLISRISSPEPIFYSPIPVPNSYTPILQVLLTWCCGVKRKIVKDVPVLEHILLDWRIWHKASEETWKWLLWKLEKLLAEESTVNKQCFNRAGAIVKLLLTSKVCACGRVPDVWIDG